MNIIGISAFYHDSAAALVRDGELVAAAQEERFSRRKHDNRFPFRAVASVMEQGSVKIDDIDAVVFYEQPFLKIGRIISSFAAHVPAGGSSFADAMVSQLDQKRLMEKMIRSELGYKGPVCNVKHHDSHAASAFYPSPFEHAAFLTIDGVGEWETTTYGVGNGRDLKMLKRLSFPQSLGLLYAAFTYFIGFKVNSGEYKVMGLAPYGEPKYSGLILNEMIDLKEDGSFRMNMDYFSHDSGASVITDKFEQLLGRSRRKPETLLAQDDMDIARSVQDVTEEIMMRMAVHIRKETGEKNLCLAGGVALNCVANGKLLRKKVFEDIWIQPAAGDAGCAAGAALYYWHKVAGGARKAGGQEPAHGSYLGPQYDPDDIEAMLKARGIPYERMADVEERVSSLLAEGKIVGWCTGRMEFGPRALGSRSILGDARVRDMQQKMNLKIKFRESFRPFAPAVLEEKASEWFDLDRPSPYMLLVTQVKADKQRQMTGEEQKLFGLEKLNVVRSQIPAVTHVDYSARVQTVSRMTNPKFHRLLSKFNQKTGCPVLINTSFNVRGEPIVCTPEDAYRCFMRTDIDYLVIEDCLIDKRKQPEWAEDEDWRQKYQLD